MSHSLRPLALLSTEFCRQEYWSRSPCPPPGDFPAPGIEPTSLVSPALADGFFTTVPPGLDPWVGKIPWRREWLSTLVSLSGEFHGQKSLAGYSQWGCKKSDTTEQLHFHFSLSCIGEGNGNPLQCSCLENPRDGGACWAAVSGVAQSRT